MQNVQPFSNNHNKYTNPAFAAQRQSLKQQTTQSNASAHLFSEPDTVQFGIGKGKGKFQSDL